MKISNFLSLVAVCSLFTVAVNAQDTNREKRDLGGNYTRIEALKGVNVSLHQCDQDEIEVVTQDCPTSDVDTYIKKGTLFIKMKKVTKGSAVQVFVKFKDVDEIEVRRGASVETECLFQHKGKLTLGVAAESEVEMEIETDEIEVDANSCQVVLSGEAKKQTVTAKGTLKDMKYDALSLKSEDIEIFASEAECDVQFTNTLKAECVAGTITYKGEDSGVVEKIESADGKIQKL
ncbi:MAG: DUF2807 domain-containing protein [Bacteroidales bacterium]|nr:DUF2807 domain-containing protein [Bacteroidales bacterium]